MAPLLQSATTPTDGQAIVTVRGDIDTDTAAQLLRSALGDDPVLSDADVELLATAARRTLRPAA